MTATSQSPFSAWIYVFIPLCVLVGPAIGTLVDLSWAISGIVSLSIARVIGPILIGAYTVGTPFALISACFFVAGVKVYHRRGLSSAHLATVLGIAVVGLGMLLLAYLNHSFGFTTLRGLPRLGIISLVSMTGCWYVARALRIV